jgi:hypothetical protein
LFVIGPFQNALLFVDLAGCCYFFTLSLFLLAWLLSTKKSLQRQIRRTHQRKLNFLSSLVSLDSKKTIYATIQHETPQKSTNGLNFYFVQNVDQSSRSTFGKTSFQSRVKQVLTQKLFYTILFLW